MKFLQAAVLGLLPALGTIFSPDTATADPLRVYQIGNSWTCINQGAWDIADSLGSSNTHGKHIAWNQTLTSLWGGAHSFSDPAPLSTALSTMQWDVVWMQPWYETHLEATAAATNMATLAFAQNPNARILIFACGPESSQGPYLSTWNRTDVENYTQQNFWKSKKNYELIVNNLRAAFPGKQIGIVPMGHCIAKVASLLESGATIPGITSVDQLLEQGGQHTSDRGSYIGQLAAYCTIFQQPPHNSTITNLANCSAPPFSVTPEFAAFMWDMVWDVVLNEPYSLVQPSGTNNLAAFNFPGFGTATITGTNVSITVPYGTDVTALAPTFNLSAGATCNPPSGTVRDFTSPVHYIVSSAAPVTTQDFTVTVNVAPYEPPIIGVQRAGGMGGGGIQLNAAQRAGAPGFAQTNWNALPYAAASGTALKDSKGAITTAAFTTNTDGISSQNMGNASTQPDEILHSGSQIRIWGDQTFNITGIPYASYKLVFYETAAGGRGSQATTLTGGPTYYLSQTQASTAAGYVDNNASTPFNYLQATSTNASAPTVDGNYVVFDNLTGSTQTVMIPGGFQVNNAFNAFQIVDTSPVGPPGANITSFNFGTLGQAAITGTAISLTVPHGTAVNALSPTFTMSSGATCDKTSGSVQNFTNPVTYTVTSAAPATTQTYTVTVNVAPPSTAADITAFQFGAWGAATISGTSITFTAPYGTVLTALSPTFTLSPGATCDKVSGSSQNFSSSVDYIVTAQAGAPSKTYTATVTAETVPPAPRVINLQIQGYNDGAGQASQITTYSGLGQVSDAPANTHWNGLPFAVNIGASNQFPALTKNFSNIVDSSGAATTVGVQISSKSGWCNNLSTTATNLGTFWQSAIYNEFGYQPTVVLNGLPPNTMVNLYLFGDAKSSYSIDGANFFAADSLVKDSFKQSAGSRFYKFTNVPTGNLGTVTITQTHNNSNPADNAPLNGLQIETVVPGGAPSTAADMLSFTFGALGAATITGTNITFTAPYGTALTALSPTFTLSPGATCNKVSGSTQNFTSPVQYIVTAEAGAPSKTYTVTVTTESQPPSAKIINLQIQGYNGGAGNNQAAQLTTYSGLGQAPDAPTNTRWNGLAFGVNTAGNGQFPQLTKNFTDILDSTGAATTVGVQINTRSGWCGNFSINPTNPGAFWQSAIYNEFGYQPTVVLSGLPPNTMVNLYLFGDAKSSYSIDGTSFFATDSPVTAAFMHDANNRFCKFTNVATGAGGTITITQTDNVTSGGNAPWNGLQIETVASSSGGFASWAVTKGLSGADAAFDADPDRDGIANGIEFVTGGEPNPANPGAHATAGMPAVTTQGNNLVVTYTRTDASAYLNPAIEFDEDMAGLWTTAVDPTNATISVLNGSPADTVTVSIPKNGLLHLFARLKAVQSNP